MNFDKIALSGIVRLRPIAWTQSDDTQWHQIDDEWMIESASRTAGIKLYNRRRGTRIQLNEDHVDHYSTDPNGSTETKKGFLSLLAKVTIGSSNGTAVEPLSAAERSRGISFPPSAPKEVLEQLVQSARESEKHLAQLQKQIAQRSINHAAFLKELDDYPPSRVEIMFVKDDPDSFRLSLEIREVLRKGKWEALEPIPIPELGSPLPSTMSVGAQPTGVTLLARNLTWQEGRAVVRPPEDLVAFKTPWVVLARAISAGLGHVKGGTAKGIDLAEGTLRIVVAQKDTN